MNPLRGWRLPLRLARRDALRHRGRAALTLVMIMLPVLAVTAADVLAKTQSVNSVESLDRRLGRASALVTVQEGAGRVEQTPDPDQSSASSGGRGASTPTEAQLDAILGGARLVPVRTGQAQVAVDHGLASVQVTETDLADPITRGLFRLTGGRWPAAPDEVVVNRALADRGYAIGDRLRVDGLDAAPRIVGVAESGSLRTVPSAAGPVGSLGLVDGPSRSWLVDGGPVSWRTVRALNAVGALVLSRRVIEHPPPAAQIPATVRTVNDRDPQTVEILALIAIMVLIEVVLLSGPAFAVGARKQQRTLALMAAAGGTPTQARRVVIGSAIVLGGTAAVAGVVLGVGLAAVLLPVLQTHSDDWFGPFDLAWLHLLGIAAFGLLSAFLAAVVPAAIASRQDVVAVLAGRRGDRSPSLRSPLLGLVLLGAGVLGSVAGVRGSGEILIAASAIPSVLGMVLLIPLALAGLGRVAGRLPLVLRYAVRDAARHRTRTVPAVAAVAATVAGVVALSIGLTSDQRQARETYSAALPHGTGIVTDYDPDPDWTAVEAAVRREAPRATVTDVVGLPDQTADGSVDWLVRVPGRRDLFLAGGETLGSILLVSDGAGGAPPPGLRLSGAEQAHVAELLAAGTSVGFVAASVDADQGRVVRTRFDQDGSASGPRQTATVPMAYVRVPSSWRGPTAILTPAAADALGASPRTVGLALTGPVLSGAQETDAQERAASVAPGAVVYVERGFQPESSAVIVQWIMIGLGAVLMLGGTLTATFLALSDARPDLATLAAVGASPRARRGVAAAYAVVVGLTGAVLGAVVGFIPGIAVTYPLTGPTDGSPGGPYIDVPWLILVVLVVGLPLLTAVVVGLCARSRLPLVARLD